MRQQNGGREEMSEKKAAEIGFSVTIGNRNVSPTVSNPAFAIRRKSLEHPPVSLIAESPAFGFLTIFSAGEREAG